MTPDQLRAARVLLGWSQMQLGLRSNTSAYLVKKLEMTGQVAGVRGRSDLTDILATIRATLEAAGVKFTDGKALVNASAETVPMTPDQVKAARRLLGWSRTQLGIRSGTSVHGVRTFEWTGQVAKLHGRRTEQVDTIAAIRAALEAAGIKVTGGGAPVLRLKEAAGPE